MAGRLVRLGIRVRADRAELALAALLPVLGDGAEERRVGDAVEYAIYAPPDDLPTFGALRAMAGDALLEAVTEPVPDGWERRHLEHLRPVRVRAEGGRLTVRAPWLDGGPDDLVIDPGASFGAGTHVSTQLCLRLLLEAEPGGGLCDWGAGSGILAVAAARLGWGPVTAVELEPDALPVIRANAAANGVAVEAVAADLRSDPVPWCPAVTANLTAALHEVVAARLARPPEWLVAAGMLRTDAAAVAAAYWRHGLRERERLVEGEWAAVVLA
jgi:ribosomal protein L11 methyltransferase